MAVSTLSLPPLVKNTFESGTGAKPATISASSLVIGTVTSLKLVNDAILPACLAIAFPMALRP